MAQKIELSAKFKRDYVAFSAVMLFVFIVIGEIALAVSIPAYMNKAEAMADQVNKLNFLQFFDSLRANCNAISSSDEVLLMEKQIISTSLDQLALYLRKEADRLSPDEIRRLDEALRPLFPAVQKLRNGKRFTDGSALNTADYINALLKKNPGGKNNAGK